jgi:hypothetical protein
MYNRSRNEMKFKTATEAKKQIHFTVRGMGKRYDKDLLEWINSLKGLDNLQWVYDNIQEIVKDSKAHKDILAVDKQLRLPPNMSYNGVFFSDIVDAKLDAVLNLFSNSTHAPNNLHSRRCARCSMITVCRCEGTKRQRKTYLPGDWRQTVVNEAADTEDNMIDILDIKKRHQEAFDLLPYGMWDVDHPPQPGDKIKVCLPQHYLQNRTGTIIEQREADGKYLVKVRHRRTSRGVTQVHVNHIYLDKNEMRKELLNVS